PAAVVGALGYALQGNVDWLAAVLLAAGIVVGAQLGSYLLSRVPTGFLRWLFMTFLAATVISLWFVVPQRDAVIHIDVLSGALLVLTGLITGVLSGLLGVGGGVVVVPILMFFFGSSDLIAKGTSLVMLIPGSISGTIGNMRRRNVDLRAAAVLGISASVLSPLGSVIATHIPPFWSNVAFSILLAFILGQMLFRTLKKK
ncbi:MAG: sulfite exporter TauE/SafE family protein, partial [Actinobacteria bacterium]|nr:sulfite exporter TauE/SafE family protein [Actinomycetota bacterium]